jgi:hypothetical protein
MISIHKNKGQNQMKAIQSRATFIDLPEAKSHFDVMASQDGFLGGRVVIYHKLIFVQTFFECNRAMVCRGNYKSPSEIVTLIPADKISKSFTLPLDISK